MNKALDYQKLLEQQEQGKLLKKRLEFPMYAQVKYDGNYATIIVENGKPRYFSSKPKEYLHPTDKTFDNAIDGVYIAERIHSEGKLGQRTETALFGPKKLQTAREDNVYKVHDYLTLEEYKQSKSDRPYHERFKILMEECKLNSYDIIPAFRVEKVEGLEKLLNLWTKQGYEGLVAKHIDWKWRNTTSRTVDFIKWKKRPTADLLCIGTTMGTGKYKGMIGALILQDSQGRIVKVGSGLDDADRELDPNWYLGKVIEIEYEQILETFIQPTVVAFRLDKTREEID